MEAHGMPKSLHKYWHNQITIPAECKETEELLDEDADGEDNDDFLKEFPKTTKAPPTTSTSTSTTTPRLVSTPLHSTIPLELEYELCEAVALSSIIINVSDLFGLGVDLNAKSHVA